MENEKTYIIVVYKQVENKKIDWHILAYGNDKIKLTYKMEYINRLARYYKDKGYEVKIFEESNRR